MRDDNRFHALIEQRAKADKQFVRLNDSKTKTEKRLVELSSKVRRLFDDDTSGVLANQNYEMLMGEIQKEQTDLTVKLHRLQSELAQQGNQAVQLEKLREVVADCLNITELSPLILNKLIDRIEVGSQEVVDGQRMQEVTIVWRFAGEV